MPVLEDVLNQPPLTDAWPTEPLPVALVITELDVGGAEKALVELATRLDRRFWAPTVISLASEGPLAGRLRDAGVPVRSLGATWRRPVRVLRDLSRALKEVSPRLVQSFLFHANVATRAAASLAGVSPVLGGIRVAEPRRSHLIAERQTESFGLGSVCVSQSVRDYWVARAGLDPRRLCVIPNGVDPALMQTVSPLPRAGLSVCENDFVALFVGRLDKQKGVDVLLDAARRVAAAEPRFRLLLAGDGPMRAAISSTLRGDPSLGACVSLLGQRDDIPALLATCDVFVLPSRWEGMPNALLEAMAAGRAVIATDVDGTREIEFTGWRMPQERPDLLATALIEAIANPARLAEFGNQNRVNVSQHHAIAATVSRYDALWWRVLGYPEVDAGGRAREFAHNQVQK